MTKRNGKRVKAGAGLAVVSLAMALNTAPPAAAAGGCNYDNTDFFGYAYCFRKPVDGDAGGVSGGAMIRDHDASDVWAMHRFNAKGEHFWVELENLNAPATFRAWYWQNGGWKRTVNTALNSGSIHMDRELPENRTVMIQTCISDECVVINTLRS